jgi:hypothetical protein
MFFIPPKTSRCFGYGCSVCIHTGGSGVLATIVPQGDLEFSIEAIESVTKSRVGIPVVRASDLYTQAFQLQGITIGSDRRNTVRIYDFDAQLDTPVLLRLFGQTTSPDGDDSLLGERVVSLTHLPQHPVPNMEPGYSQFALEQLFESVHEWPEYVRLEIEPMNGGRIWAFATLTKSVTQQVTVILPDKGH